jgi:diguanylate cyclase (GGDEF)-like protein
MNRNFFILLAGILGATLVAWLDYLTQARMSFYLFYFPSIMVAAWYGTLRVTVMMVFLCSTAWLFANPHWKFIASDLIVIWNLIVRILTFTLVASTTRFIKGKQRSLESMHQKVVELLELEKELSRKDYLTGAVNNRAFEEKMTEERAKAKRYGHMTSLLYIDLDHFKAVNDNHGHQYGDRILKEVVFVIEKNIRDVDVLARLGGDEFAILLPETDQEKAKNCATRILDSINKCIPPPLTASIGVVLFNDHSLSCAEIIKMADDAMYQAKRQGRNRLIFVQDKP